MNRRFRELFLLREAVFQALASLRGYPLRTALGALAIFVAVFTMAFMVTALEGVATYARANAAKLFGSDTFVLAQIASPGQTSRRDLERKLQRNPPIRRADTRAVERLNGDKVIYAPNAQRNAEVAAGGRTYDYAAITGTTPEITDLRDLGLARGRFFRADELTRAAQVAVVGADIVDALFPAQDPLGQRIRIGGRGFDVIGVQGRLGTSGGTSLDRYVWIPLTTFERVLGVPPTLQIFAGARGGESAEVAEDRARSAMRAHRQLRPGIDDTFDVLTPNAARGFVLRLSERIGVAAVPISLAALLAAVVVVTNTVLVSVTQRTREIGVRRALGASRRQILREVLAESTIVSMGGGMLAIAVVWALADVVGQAADLPLALRPSTAAWSLFASSFSGLAAGWYPARRAVRIDPIAALRAE